MVITDEQGNKLPQPKISKRIKSGNERSIAANISKQTRGENGRCPRCGYHVRGIGHFLAKHHKN